MQTKTIAYIGSILILPILYVGFYAIRLLPQGHAIEQYLPRWDRLLLIATIILFERVYTYRYAVSQRAVLTRDILSSAVNLWITGAATIFLLLPVLQFFPQHFLGRKFLFAAPAELGPFWLQFVAILFAISFSRYWIHRLQHEFDFLWAFHSYHHRTTDLKALNADVSHPIDYALRNVVIFIVLGLVGFDPVAILFAVPVTRISNFSHCGAELKAGLLNYVIMTPEVHRWHHSAEIPEGHRYAVNYGVEFSFWDILFGTFHLPRKDGQFEQPLRIGHPGGLPDEPSYLRSLLTPMGLYRPSWFKPEPERRQPAE